MAETGILSKLKINRPSKHEVVYTFRLTRTGRKAVKAMQPKEQEQWIDDRGASIRDALLEELRIMLDLPEATYIVRRFLPYGQAGKMKAKAKQ